MTDKENLSVKTAMGFIVFPQKQVVVLRNAWFFYKINENDYTTNFKDIGPMTDYNWKLGKVPSGTLTHGCPLLPYPEALFVWCSTKN